MRIHCLLPFLQELKSICGPARLLLFLRDKLVVRRQLKRFGKNRTSALPKNLFTWQQLHVQSRAGFAKGEALRLLRPNSSRSTFNEKRTELQICLKNREYLELFSAGETVYLKTEKTARTHENNTFCSTISSGFANPQEHTDRVMTP